ncbi:ABC transporter permease [Flavobacteriaceae bacterium GF1]
MYKNYIKTAWRNLKKNVMFSSINILGLGMGIACFTLFLLFALNEFNYNRFHTNADRIYRVYEWTEGIKGRTPQGFASAYTPLGPSMKSDFTDIEHFVRVYRDEEKFFKIGTEISQSEISYADPELFKVFSFEILEGNSSDPLGDPNNIVLTENEAIRLFGSKNAIGQTLEIKTEDSFVPFKVSAVAENIPSNSSIQFSALGSYEYFLSTGLGKQTINNWDMGINSETYVQLSEQSTLMAQPERIAKFRKKYYPNEENQAKEMGIWDGKGAFPISFQLQPLAEVHTNPKIDGIADTVEPKNIWLLIGIASGILLIACINFTTLSIGRSAKRVKEIGLRKVIGGKRKQLLYQFLSESILLSFLAGFLGLLILFLVLPMFNTLAETSLQFSFTQFPEFALYVALLVLLTGILAGTYPAFIMSGLRPALALKNNIKLSGSNLFTKSLVTFQFVLSIALGVSTYIILQQLNFMRSKDLGFEKENVLVVDATGTDARRIYPLLKQELATTNYIKGITASEMGMGAQQGTMRLFFEYGDKSGPVVTYPVDTDFVDVLGMQMVSGRSFNPRFASDSLNSVIVNEAFLKEYNIPRQEAIGKLVLDRVPIPNGEIKTRAIIGVIKDFNFGALSKGVEPQIFIQPASLNARKIYIRLNSKNISKSISLIGSKWRDASGNLPFQYAFLDKNFESFYKNEERWGRISGSAGLTAIFLACLGLFGLTALSAVKRTKEIGIRKVLGASSSSVAKLLSKEFTKLVLFAILIASPIVWYVMNKWLQDYAYRINIDWWVFIGAGALAIGIALFTVSFQAIKAANTNPVKSLMSE